MKKKFAAGTLAVALAVGGLLFASPAMATEGPDEPGESADKVLVCKYVGTPGEDERLKDGKNPTSVSENALEEGFTGEFPWEFSDQHGKSVAVAWDEGQEDPASLCPPPEGPAEPEPEGPALPIDLCHGYGTADASIVTVTTEAEFQEHAVVHKDAPMSAENCDASKPAPPVEVCHGYGTVDASLIVLDSPEAIEEHAVGHKDAPMSAENCEGSNPLPVDVCHAYGTADAELVTLTDAEAFTEHTGHGDAPMSAENCESSKPATFSVDLCHGYGTEAASIVTVTTEEGLQEHAVGHGDSPMSAEDCEASRPEVAEPTPVTLADPQVFDLCGTEDDDIAFPADTEGVHYAWKTEDPASPAYWTLRAWVAEGYEVQGPFGDWTAFDGGYELSFEMTDEPCEVTPTPEPTEPEPTEKPTPAPAGTDKSSTDSLALTGSDMSPILPIAGGVIVMAGLALMAVRRFARN